MKIGNRGFNLIELVISTGLVTVVFLGFSQVLDAYINDQTNLSFADRKQDILIRTINLINNNYGWQKTINFSANHSMDCLKDPATFPAIANAGNCTMADGGKFSLLDQDGNIYLDNVNSSSGFTLSMGPCSSYDPSGTDVCPLRAEVSWRPLCVGCLNPQVEVTITLTDSPSFRKTVQAKVITRKLIRYAQRYDPDLVLWLKMDGTDGNAVPTGTIISDFSGFSNDATMAESDPSGGPSHFRPGVAGQGVELTTYKYLTISDSPSIKPGGALTVSAWVNPNTVGIWAGIVDKRYQGIYDSYVMRMDVPGFDFCVAENGGNRCVYAALAVAPNTWYHVVGTWDVKNIKIYVNGFPAAASLAYNGPNFWSADPLLIGFENQNDCFGIGCNSTFPGIIDQVKIWRRALTPYEVQMEFQNP